jgi:membrane-associated phospholipid phosphatase
MISISVMFVKQHSFVDVVAAIPLGIIAYALVYGKHSIVQ